MAMPTESISGADDDAVDPGTAFKLLLACPYGISRSQLSADLDPSYDMIAHPQASLEESLNEAYIGVLCSCAYRIWNGRLEENPSLYNGQKFRYGGHSLRYKDDLHKVFSVCLHLGLMDYSLTAFKLDISDHRKDELVPQIVLVVPQEVGISAHRTRKGSAKPENLNHKVSQEIFDGIIREVVEEIGVPANSLTDPIFIGISLRDMNVDLEKMASKMPGCHHGGYALYELMTRVPKDT